MCVFCNTKDYKAAALHSHRPLTLPSFLARVLNLLLKVQTLRGGRPPQALWSPRPPHVMYPAAPPPPPGGGGGGAVVGGSHSLHLTSKARDGQRNCKWRLKLNCNSETELQPIKVGFGSAWSLLVSFLGAGLVPYLSLRTTQQKAGMWWVAAGWSRLSWQAFLFDLHPSQHPCWRPFSRPFFMLGVL